MAQGDIFGGDPFTGQGVFQSSAGGTADMDLAAAFGGRFYISGGSLVDTEDPGSPLSLGQQGMFTIQDVGNGRYSLASRIAIDRINRPSSAEVLRTVQGSVDVLRSDGTVETLTMGSVAVNQIGFQAIVYPQDDGGYGITHIRGIYANNAELQAEMGVQYRLASPTESIQAALSKKLYMDNQDALQRIGEEEGILDEAGNVDLSGVVRRVMQQVNLQNIQAFSQWLFE